MLKTPQRMSRKVKGIYVNIGKNGSFLKIQENPGFQHIIIAELICAIEDGVKQKKRKITLFEIDNSNYKIVLERKDWKSSLSTAMSFYLQHEDYPKCAKIRDIISNI